MTGTLPRLLGLFLLIFTSISLSGCGDDRPEQIEKYQALSQQRLSQLAKMLDDNQLRNANLLRQYSGILIKQRPQLAPLVEELAKDAGTEGPLYQSLQRRLSELNSEANFIDVDQRLNEAKNLYEAIDPSLYNDILSDPLNVIADMSQGSLARVNSISKEAAALANGSEDMGAGSQLVGNPGYGSWQNNSSGTSIWAWYGMYAMFSNLTNGPIGYNRWSSRRGYSYYNDVGRYRYTSPKQASSQNSTFEREKKRFSSQGKSFQSPYAKNRSGATSLSRQSTSTPSASKAGTSPSKFRSNYSKDSSFRNSSSRTSRGVRRGK
jgi:hypothetical protein